MNGGSRLYDRSLALLTDLYQITMAYGYWKLGRIKPRRLPPLSAPILRRRIHRCCGLEEAINFFNSFRSRRPAISSHALTGNDDKRLFDPKFLDYLADLKFTCDVDAVPEGTAVFPHEPLISITGPILRARSSKRRC